MQIDRAINILRSFNKHPFTLEDLAEKCEVSLRQANRLKNQLPVRPAGFRGRKFLWRIDLENFF